MDRNYFYETYKIIGKLGAGSGGIVYKAYHNNLRKEVVIKQLKYISTDMNINRQEVDILKNLHHMYLPQVFDFLEVDGSMYLVMSYIEGYSIQDLMDKEYCFTRQQVIKWGTQLADVLVYLHAQKPAVIHGDIKPGNIMITVQGDIRLIDFNISFLRNDHMIFGYSNGYCAPEVYIAAEKCKKGLQLSMDDDVDERSDLYSVGATLFHMITGHRFYEKQWEQEIELLYQYTEETLADIIQKLLQKNPDDRYSSAEKLRYDFQNIWKKSKEYKHTLYKKRLIRCGIVSAICIIIVAAGYGVRSYKEAKKEKYNQIVVKQITYYENQEYEKAEKQYKKAIAVLPGGWETSYQQALTLYQQQEYKKCVQFIDYDIFQNKKISLTKSRTADIYYLQGKGYFELEEYERSITAFETAIQYEDKKDYYRDYAIALAYYGQLNQANKVLDSAIKKGMEEASVYYTKGEIEKIEESYQTAINDFKQCIDQSDDDELSARAYLMIAEIQEQKKLYGMQREILVEGHNKLPLNQQMNLLEQLVRVDIYLADKMGSKIYSEEAIEMLRVIIEQGWDTYDTYDNLAVLYEENGDYSQVEQVLETMNKKYGEDYNLYKRYAFLEVDKQEKKSNENRDYRTFYNYYLKTKNLYEKEAKHGDTDSEMQLLDTLYNQIQKGGWLS